MNSKAESKVIKNKRTKINILKMYGNKIVFKPTSDLNVVILFVFSFIPFITRYMKEKHDYVLISKIPKVTLN